MNFDPTILLCTLSIDIGLAGGYALGSFHQFLSEGRAMVLVFVQALENYIPEDYGRE